MTASQSAPPHADSNHADITRLLAEAFAAANSGGHNTEQRLLAEAFARAPNNPQALNALGLNALARAQLNLAWQCFAYATSKWPRNTVFWLNLATTARRRGAHTDEENALSRALSLDQTCFVAWLRKAELYDQIGDPSAALTCWRAALATAPAPSTLSNDTCAKLEQARKTLSDNSARIWSAIDQEVERERASLGVDDRRRFDACVDAMLGRRRLYHNDCSGLHFPFLPADEFFERKHFAWLGQLETHTSAIRSEFLSLAADREGFRPYIAQPQGTPENLWTPLDHSMCWSSLFLWEYGAPTPFQTRCPNTMAALDTVELADIPGRGPTAFFSVLQAHTRIPPHTGVTNVRAIVHLPLIVPEKCGFRVGGQTRAWQEGCAFVFDDTIEHEAWNESDHARAVLILDVWNPHLSGAEKTLLRCLFRSADAKTLP